MKNSKKLVKVCFDLDKFSLQKAFQSFLRALGRNRSNGLLGISIRTFGNGIGRISIILYFFIWTVPVCHAQIYPRWFLEPVNLGKVAAGCTQNFFLQSSSDSAAFVKACENLARQHYIKFQGGEAFWETEAGVYWMGDNFTEKIDSSFLNNVFANAKKVAVCSGNNMTFVLAADGGMTIPDSMRSTMKCSRNEPGWVEAIPAGSGYIYAEGVAPQYFYESSSWEAAEKRARFNIARNMKVTLETMQKVNDQSGQEIRSEEISEELRDIEVVYRWRDAARGLYYVLLRMPNK